MKHRVPASKCLGCGKIQDAAAHPKQDGIAPKAGDFGICFYCGHVGVYRANLTMRAPTQREKRRIDSSREIAAARKAIELTWWSGIKTRQ